MKRRQLLIAGPALFASPLLAVAQQPRIWRMGFLVAGSSASLGHLLEALKHGLRELDYVEGHNLAVEARWARGQMALLPGLAAELVRLNVDLIVAGGAPAVQAAQKATRVIPIIMGAVNDPVGLGFADSLARPGGNITGLSNMGDETTGKLVELAHEIVPEASRAAVLLSGDAASQTKWNDAQKTAKALKLSLMPIKAANAQQIETAFAEMVKERIGALIVPADTFLNTQRKMIVELAARNKLPAVYARREYATDGGLVSYGLSLTDLFRRCAAYADRIFKGARPGELPIEQPAKFELVLNLKTAKGLGVRISPPLLLRADEVIQ
jgi:putative ABC transport system substrate-binding protein